MRTPPNERLTSDIAEAAETRNFGSGKSCAKDTGPERKCILTGENASRDALVRLAISPDGDVLCDPLAKAPGRGAWIGVSRAQLELALSKGQLKGALARAFKGTPLNISADLPDQIQSALERVFLDRLGIEMRGGQIVLGSDRIAEQARKGRVALLMHANDASEDGRKKLDQAWRVGRDLEGSGERGVTLPLDRAALSVALGRDNVVHLGVNGSTADSRLGAKAAGRVGAAVSRLLQYTKAEGSDGNTGGAQLASAKSDQSAGDKLNA
ncbi:MAG: DUF448 domain-containing protein [Erythrobacter sp.]